MLGIVFIRRHTIIRLTIAKINYNTIMGIINYNIYNFLS